MPRLYKLHEFHNRQRALNDGKGTLSFEVPSHRYLQFPPKLVLPRFALRAVVKEICIWKSGPDLSVLALNLDL